MVVCLREKVVTQQNIDFLFPTTFRPRQQVPFPPFCMVEQAQQQGCQIFLGTKYQNWKNVPNYHELYQMSIKYIKRP
jgi:hypothetical protein